MALHSFGGSSEIMLHNLECRNAELRALKSNIIMEIVAIALTWRRSLVATVGFLHRSIRRSVSGEYGHS